MAKITRKMRFEYRMTNAAETKAINKVRKAREGKRRDARMLARLEAGSLPYTPDVMSWLSRKLDKASSKITQAEVAKLKS
jgi:hypothetical protein